MMHSAQQVKTLLAAAMWISLYTMMINVLQNRVFTSIIEETELGS